MGSSMLTWIKDQNDDSQLFPAVIVFGLFGFIYILEKLVPGAFFAILSTALGASALWFFQGRSARLPGPLQQFFGLEDTFDTPDGGSDRKAEGQDSGDEADSPTTPGGSTWMMLQKRKEGNEDVAAEDDDGGLYGEATKDVSERSCAWPNIDENGDCLSPANGNGMLGDWFESMGGQDIASGGGQGNGDGVAGAAPGEDAANDPMNKARLDLLLRYLSSMEGGNEKQAPHVTPQRQKLQRKLLQRTAGLSELPSSTSSFKSNRAAKTGSSEGNSQAAAGADADPAAGSAENLLEDSANIEALLRELGEDAAVNVNAPKVVPTKGRGPAKRARKKGSSPSKEAPGPSISGVPTASSSPVPSLPGAERLVKECQDESEGDEETEEEEDEQADNMQIQSTKRLGVPHGHVDDFHSSEFQVVANRKARRKDKKDTPVSTPEAVIKEPKADPKARSPSDSPLLLETKEVSHQSAKAEQQPPARTRREDAAVPVDALGKTKISSTTKAAVVAHGNTPIAFGEVFDSVPPPKAATLTGAAVERNATKPAKETAEAKTRSARGEKWADVEVEGRPGARAQGADEGDDEVDDWEWQCPDGFPLAEQVLAAPMLCGSCGEMQPEGSSVLIARESGWAACEECIRIAFGQPVEPQEWDEASSSSAAVTAGVVDPSRMSALEIATWFQERGAENELRQCMLKIMATDATSKESLTR